MIKNSQRQMIMQAFEVGVTKDTDAISYSGVSREWYYRELKTNPKFAAEIEAAKTKRKMRALAIILKAAKTNWSAAGWFLERTYQEEFAIKQRHEVSGPGGTPIATREIRFPNLTNAELKKLASMVVPEGNGSSNGHSDNPVAGPGA